MFSSISRISDTATHDRPSLLSTLDTTSCTREETSVPALSTKAYSMQIGREGAIVYLGRQTGQEQGRSHTEEMVHLLREMNARVKAVGSGPFPNLSSADLLKSMSPFPGTGSL